MSEVSSSIAETNRMRAEMGLPPLAISSAEDRLATAAAARAADEAAVERARVEAIRAELARRKEARIVNARVAGQSLGESLVSATAGSARDWIERSRKLGTTEAAKAAALVASRAAAEQAAINDEAYTASALAGVKVAHSASDFASGSSTILTLKDSRILTGGAGDALNDEEDELLNADLVESEKIRENNARKAGKSAKHAARFDTHDDEESELLAKYSETKAKEGIRLGAAGTLTIEEQDFQSNRALYEQDDARRKLNQLVYSLDDGANAAGGAEKDRVYQSDFKEVKFKKKKAGAGAKANGAVAATGVAAMDESATGSATAASDSAAAAAPKKRANRKVKAPTESLLDFLPEPSAEERAADLSSRNGGPQSSAKQRREAEEARAAKDEKDARYLRAIQAAEHKSAQRSALDKIQAEEFAAAAANAPAASSGSFVPPPPSSAPPAAAFKSAAPAFGSAGFVPPPPPPMPAPAAAAALPAMAPPPGLWEEEEDLELAATLARARRIAAQQRKKHEGGSHDDGEGEEGQNGESNSKPDSVRALADMVKEKRREDLIRVKQEPVEDDAAADSAAASSSAAAASSSAAAGAAAPAARSAPPGMRVKTEGASGGIVFTTTTEFVRGLQFDREEREQAAAAAAAKASAAVKAEASSGVQAMDLDEEKKVSVQDVTAEAEGMKDEHDGDRGASSSSDDDSDEDDNGGLRGVGEPYARTGVAAALALYKARGILKEGGNGRGRSAEDIAGDKFNLGKYDAFGREQSKKEQFRALSHRFHGIEPGLNKQEKRLQRVQEEAQRLQALRESGGVINKVAERTKATGAAHVVLDKDSSLLRATGAGEDGGSEEAGQKRKKHAGPFAQFGFGKGSFKKRKAAQEADAKKKGAAAGAGAAADVMQ